jgi:hypothetical protein
MSPVANKPNRKLPLWGLLLAALTPVLLRVLIIGYVPLGVDGGQWVAHGRALFSSEHPRGLYPPLVPLLSWVLTLLLPFRSALSLLAVAAAAAPGVGVGLFARRLDAPRTVAVLSAFAVSATGLTGEAFLWAGYPQLIALAFVPLALLSLEELLAIDGSKQRTRSSQRLLAVSIIAIACTSHLVLLSTAVGVLVLLAVRLRHPDRRSALRSLRRPAFYAVLAAIVLSPVYLSLSETFAASRVAREDSRFSQLLDFYDYLLRLETIPYLLLLCTAAVLLWCARRSSEVRTPLPGALASKAAVLCAVLLPFLLRERRLAYIAGTALAMLVVTAFSSWRSSKRRFVLLSLVTVLVAGASSAAGVARTQADHAFYNFVTPAALELAQEVATFSEQGDTIAVASVRTLPYGWWVEGVAARRTYSMASGDVLYRASEKRDLDVVLEVFKASTTDPFPSKAGLAQARYHSVSMLVTPWEWGGVTSRELGLRVKQCSDPCEFSVVFQNEYGALIRVNS